MYQIWHAIIVLLLPLSVFLLLYLHVQCLFDDRDDAVEAAGVEVGGEVLAGVAGGETHMVVAAERVEHVGERRVGEVERMCSPCRSVRVGLLVHVWRAFAMRQRG